MKTLWTALMVMTILTAGMPASAEENPSMRLTIQNTGKYEAEAVVQNNDQSTAEITNPLPAGGTVIFSKDETTYSPELPFNKGWGLTVWVTAPGQSQKHKCPYEVQYVGPKAQCVINRSACPAKYNFQGHCEISMQINTSEVP